MATFLRIKRDSVDRRPEYRAAVESMAVAANETHYTVPAAEYRALVSGAEKPPTEARRRAKLFALGDAVETALTSVGITKELVQRVTRTKDCGCKARAKRLNQWGYVQQQKVARLAKKAARWYGIS